MEKPLVSVIIPAFNSGDYVLEAIASAHAQTYSSLEVIVVDDGSTDDTAEKLRGLIETERIRYHSQPNQGLGAARNTGIQLAKGKYLQFLDADDLIAPTKIEKQVRRLESSSTPSVCGSDFRCFEHANPSELFGGDSFKGKFPLHSSAQLFEFETVIHRWLFPAALVREAGGFETNMPATEDWLLLWKLAAGGTRFEYVDEPLALYRKHGRAMTADFERLALGHLLAIEEVERYQKAHRRSLYSQRELNALRESYHYPLGLLYVRQNRSRRAWKHLLKALVLAPNRRQVKLLLLAAIPAWRANAISRAGSANERLWRWRAQLRKLRTQPSGVTRFAAGALLLIVWPVKLVVDAVLNALNERQPKRIVVIQLAGLGDLLMLTPSLAALKQNYPNAKIDFITLHNYVRDAFANHPRLDSITALPQFSGRWITAKFVNRSGWRLMLATLECYPALLLKKLFVRYDLGINFGLSDFDRNLGNALLYGLNARRRIGSNGRAEQLLTERANVNGDRSQRAVTYLKFLEPLGISATREAIGYEFPVRAHEIDQVKLALRRENIDSALPLVVMHPGGKLHVNSRRWPAKYFASVCQVLSQHEGFQIVLTGDQDDAGVCDEIAQAAGPKVKSVAGRLSFSETAALLSLSQLFITNDTSTLHLADAVKVPRVISIFGPTDPEQLVPRNERHIVFRSRLPCAPCMGGLIDAKTERCWREVKEECLSEISPEQVIAVVRQYSRRPAVRAARA